MNGLKDALAYHGIKQKWLAEQLGVCQQTVYNWTNGRHSPTNKMKRKISRVLDIPVGDIFFDPEGGQTCYVPSHTLNWLALRDAKDDTNSSTSNS